MREGTAFQLSGDESVNTDGVALEDETDMPEADGSSTSPSRRWRSWDSHGRE